MEERHDVQVLDLAFKQPNRGTLTKAQRMSAETLKSSRSAWALAGLSSLPDGVVSIDTDENVRMINEACVAITGVAGSSFEGTSWRRLCQGCGPQGEAAIERMICAALSRGESTEDDTVVFFDRGGKPPAVVNVRVRPVHKGRPVIGATAVLRDVSTRWYAEQRVNEVERQLRIQQEALLQLSKWQPGAAADITDVLRSITQTAARSLNVERVSVWLFDADRSRMKCLDIYHLGRDAHESGSELVANDYPAYFRALEAGRAIAADDAHTDPATFEFSQGYLTPLGIASMMDAPIRRGGEVIGVLCHEHVGAQRHWSVEEQNFSASLADTVCLAIGFFDHKSANDSLKRVEHALRKIHELTSTASLTFTQKVQGLLQMGCAQLGLDMGILARVSGDVYRVMVAVPIEGFIEKDQEFVLDDTYCCEVVRTQQPMAVEHVGQSPWKAHPAYREHRLEAYIGLPVVVNGAAFGTLSFLSIEPRQTHFSATDHEIVQLVARWIGAELERQENEARMRKLSSALEQTADAVMITDRDGTIEYINRAFEVMSGYTPAELKGRNPSILKSGQETDEFYARLHEALARGEPFSNVFINRRKSGEVYYQEETISPLRDDSGTITHFISTSKDVSEQVESKKRLFHLAHYDILTGLPNRVMFAERLAHALRQAQRNRQKVAVMLLDLDHFKNVNDTLGHGVGDELLKQVAARLNSSVRGTDTVARLGGDEFTVLLECLAQVDDAGNTAAHLMDACREPFTLNGNEVYVTASLGVAAYPDDAKTGDDLMKAADTAMYHAKESGRDAYRFFTPDMTARVLERVLLESQLRRALENEEFEVYFQPRVNLRSGRAVGAEALLRWNSPTRGLVAPSHVIGVLEETRLIIPVGDWILSKTCDQIRDWERRGIDDLRVSVNLSAVQFRQHKLAARIDDILHQAGVAPEKLELEITESVLMDDVEDCSHALEEFREMGIRVSIDDFGTGFSSMSYLKRFPVQNLKIDASFVHDVTTNPDDAAIAEAILSLGRTLKMDVTAEGVETADQLEFLRSRGCDEGQGFLYSMPLAATGFEEWLRRSRV